MGTSDNYDFRSLMDMAKQNCTKISPKAVVAKAKNPSEAVKAIVKKSGSRAVPVPKVASAIDSKKSRQVDSDAVANFLAKKRQQDLLEKQKQKESRENLLKLRMEARGGKITKKIADAFRLQYDPTPSTSLPSKPPPQTSLPSKVPLQTSLPSKPQKNRKSTTNVSKDSDVKPRPSEEKRPEKKPEDKNRKVLPPANPMDFQQLLSLATRLKDKPVGTSDPKTHEKLVIGKKASIPEPTTKHLYEEKGRELKSKGKEKDKNIGRKVSNPPIKPSSGPFPAPKTKISASPTNSNSNKISNVNLKNDTKTNEKLNLPPWHRPNDLGAPTQKRKAPVDPFHSRAEDKRKFSSMHQNRFETQFDSDEEEDSDMADFIDDTEMIDNEDVSYRNFSKHIKEIFKYDRSKYVDEPKFDDRRMESRYNEIEKEEAFSARIGLKEDLEDYKREQAALKKRRIEK